MVFLGRIAIEKRPDRAIEIAREFGMRLVIAAKVDPTDQDCFDTAIVPHLNHNRGLVEFVGEVDEAEKDELLGKAFANIFPIDWPEPVGLTMAESMATGTPVVTGRVGSTPEIVEHGVSGFLCDSTADMVDALGRIPQIDRHGCCQHVETRFSPGRWLMATSGCISGSWWTRPHLPTDVWPRRFTSDLPHFNP